MNENQIGKIVIDFWQFIKNLGQDCLKQFMKLFCCIIRPKVIIQLSMLLLCLGFLYFSVFKSLFYDWLHLPDFSHGFLVPLISLYFIWEHRDKLEKAVIRPQNSGLGLILFGTALLIIGNISSESFTMRISFPVIIFGLVLFLLGWLHVKLLFFPLSFLVFMIPIPSILLVKITFPMQLLASKIAAAAIYWCGIPVFREGNILNLANTSLEVAEACSGIRSLISLLALGTVFAYIMRKSLWQRVIMVLSCFPIAIMVNIFRVTITGILVHNYGSSVAHGFFHDCAGYFTFIIALLVLFGLNFIFSKMSISKTA